MGVKYLFFHQQIDFHAFNFHFCFISTIFYSTGAHAPPFCEISFFGLIFEQQQSLSVALPHSQDVTT